MRAEQLPTSIIKASSNRAREIGAINLGQGIPSFSAPEAAKNAAIFALENDPDIDKYPNYLGVPELRQEIANRLSNESMQNIKLENILITVGAMEACQTIISSIVEPGDRVAVITPDYATHFSQLMLPDAVEVNIPMKEELGWQINLDAIEQESRRGLKLLLITNPNNPTGSVISQEQLEQLISLSEEYGFWLLSDETYSYLTYDDVQHTSLTNYLNDHVNLLITKSFSKEYAMTGWRVGYLVADAEFIPEFAKTHDALVGTAPRISQMAALGVLQGDQSCVNEYVNAFSKRREYVIDRLSQIPGCSLVAPDGAYYAFPSYEDALNSKELAETLLEEWGVNIIPGEIFGDGGQFHFRISMGPEFNVLEEGLNRIESYFKYQHRKGNR